MFTRLSLVTSLALLASLVSAHAGPCTAEIEKLKSEIDAKAKAGMAGNPSLAESLAAAMQRPPQPPANADTPTAPTAQGVTPLENVAAVHLAMARAMAADTIGDKSTCDQALADVRSALSR